jgi:UDP-N-acetylglucosamine diphosphorylase / glucose-1-phosphate thymidylyltransferase / UDP-N-acetylgalactosamine diphosphorylase / glucosamine-1-phosphate N-acetyltransferase / galactosamine-1-phosphate N-acetyltransferase
MKDTTLIVLAGGEGKRFWPFTTNKALFPFFGLPLFAQTIADVPAVISRMVIVTSPVNNATIRSYHFPIDTATVMQREPKGMADALLACKEVVKNSPIVIVNVDDVFDPRLLSQICKTDAYGVIPGWKAPLHGPFGYLYLAGERVTGIVEKPEAGREPSPYANVVCHYVADGAAFITELSKTKSPADDVYEKALSNLMAQHKFIFFPYEGPLAVLKYPWHVLDVMSTLFHGMEKHKGKDVVIKEHVVIEGQVYIEDGVKIFENSKILGPCYIGKNTIIGNNNIIRQSHIGSGCVTGFNTDITRSYVGNDCWFHSNYIGDSVLEGNISMGSGAVLANLRLDDGEIKGTGRNKLGAMVGKGVRIGVNASVMPGVKIGKNSFIGAGVVLDRDLPENSFCTPKPGITITKNLKAAPASRETFKKKL